MRTHFVPGMVLGARAVKTSSSSVALTVLKGAQTQKHVTTWHNKAVTGTHTKLVADGVVEGSHGTASKVVFELQLGVI